MIMSWQVNLHIQLLVVSVSYLASTAKGLWFRCYFGYWIKALISVVLYIFSNSDGTVAVMRVTSQGWVYWLLGIQNWLDWFY